MTIGSGQRGDMQAVIAAILLDPEARRGDVSHHRERRRRPPARADSLHRQYSARIWRHVRWRGSGQQRLLDERSASWTRRAFSISFPPDYNIPGTNLLGPEFDLETTATTLVRANFVNSFVYGSIGTGTTVSFTTLRESCRESECHRPIARFAERAAAAQRDDVGRARQHSRGSERRSGRQPRRIFCAPRPPSI